MFSSTVWKSKRRMRVEDRKIVQRNSRSSKKEKKGRINKANTACTREEIFQSYTDCRQKERNKYTRLGE